MANLDMFDDNPQQKKDLTPPPANLKIADGDKSKPGMVEGTYKDPAPQFVVQKKRSPLKTLGLMVGSFIAGCAFMTYVNGDHEYNKNMQALDIDLELHKVNTLKHSIDSLMENGMDIYAYPKGVKPYIPEPGLTR